MSNICSTYIRIYPKESITVLNETFQTGKVITELLSGLERGYSYCTPVYWNFGPYGKYIEIALGFKSFPSNVSYYFESHKHEIEMIFLRYIYDEYDYIRCIFDKNENQTLFKTQLIASSLDERICKYGFDKIIFYSNHEINNDAVRKVSDGIFELFLVGTYKSRSYFRDLEKHYSFAEYKINEDGYANWGFNRDLQCNNDELFIKIEEIAKVIEFYYKEKLVTYSISKEEYLKKGFKINDSYLMNSDEYKWLHFPFDSWYNCIDEYYLDYNKE